MSYVDVEHARLTEMVGLGQPVTYTATEQRLIASWRMMSFSQTPERSASEVSRVIVAILLAQPPEALVKISKICPSGVLFTVMYILSTQDVWRTSVQPSRRAISLRWIGCTESYLISGC